MTDPSADLMVVVGEASGDEHAAALYRELKLLRPGVRAFGLTGDRLIAEGVESIGHASRIAVVGLVEALKVLPAARGLYRRLLEEARRRGTRVALLVDSPGFNLRLARALSRRGVHVLYYISPQLWAWREARVEAVRRYVDKVLVLFDFEVDWYRERGVETVHVGHPLVDSVPDLESAWERTPSPERPVIGFMPGSRRSEIDRLLPEMVGAAQAIAGALSHRDPAFRVICAVNIDPERLRSAFANAGVTVEVVTRDRYRAIADSHLIVCASGTATLEVGLLRTPMIVVYRLQDLTHRLARRVVRTEYISLVNLVLGSEVVPELLQQQASAAGIASSAVDLLTDSGRISVMRRRLSDLRQVLGASGASLRAARAVAEAMTGAAIGG